MSASRPLTCRRIRSSKWWSVATVIAMIASTVSPALVPTVSAQTGTAPVGAGFTIDPDDLRFIFHAIEVAQAHAVTRTNANPCGTLVGPGPNQVNIFGAPSPQIPLGLRTVDGSCNNLVPNPDQHLFGASDQLFPRLLTPNFRSGDVGSYTQLSGDIVDSQPRVISNLIVDQTSGNAAAAAAAVNVCGSGGFVCSGAGTPDTGVAGSVFPQAQDTGSIFIPNTTPDFGLSAPFNLMFTFFGQFFDHGLDLVNKGGNGSVIIPLQPDDPLYRTGVDPAFNQMTMPRASVNQDHNAINQTTPWVDQNQTYTSHPSHQVFLRQYAMDSNGKPVQDGKMLDGGHCSARSTGIPGDNICNIGNWGEVKAQAATKLGLRITDADLFNVPLLLTDPYGHFKPGPSGFPQLVDPASPGGLLEGDPAGGGVAIPATALRTNHQFLNDVAHSAVPTFSAPGVLNPDPDTTAGGSLDAPICAIPGCYDTELLDLHFITGDGRGNENIALTTMHTIFHSEHNRLVADIDRIINTPPGGPAGSPFADRRALSPDEIAAWHSVDPGSGWGYGERLFQAARFVTEMEYQHLVFEEFARKVQPLINPFLGGITSINGAISAEFAHTVYRLGHSMLPEQVNRINRDPVTGAETPNDKRLFDAFLNPAAFNDGGTAGTLTTAQAVGSVVRGLSRQVGNELDEFTTNSVRNTLVGLPLDLPAINIARGRSEGIPTLNAARRQIFAATRNSALTPYANWFEFGLNLKHRQSLVNFIAAYGTDPSITSVPVCPVGGPFTTCGLAGKRAAATVLVNANAGFLFAPAATSGLDDVDFWVGGLAERQTPFGGLLGSTFNYVFELQLENLQNGDRFYYLQRLDGLGLRFQLESNSFSELAMRNSDSQGTMQLMFNTADFNFDMVALNAAGPATIELGNGMQLITTANGTKLFFDPLHTGKNIVFNGGPGDDRMQGDIGDDTLYGNGGNDRLEGGDGNDILVGGDGDDVLFGGNGDDVLKGGPGNDALSSGPGFGADLLMGGEGNDFLLGGDDGVEHFGGGGDDVIVDGAMRAEGIFGGPGDDWIEAGDGHDGGIFGDDGNVFDLLAGLSKIGGDDVLDGGPGQDNHFGEGGDDIMLPSEGTNKFFGDFGFDWITMRGWPVGAEPTGAIGFSVDLDLLAVAGVPLNFNDLRNKYRMVDGASGWKFDDILLGDNHVNDPAAPPELFNLPGTELLAGTAPTQEPAVGVPGQFNFRGGSGAAKIAGLTQFMADFAAPLPFNAGNILIGGEGSDTLEGRGGDDLLDGDLWLNVQLRAVMNDGSVRFVDHATDLVADVFADPQRLNPGNISIIRTIVTPPPVPVDCAAATFTPGAKPLNCDTASFRFPITEYLITPNANGTITVAHTAGVRFIKNDGTDTLRNIELLQFHAGIGLPVSTTIVAPGVTFPVKVPSVVGLTQAAAGAPLTGAFLTVGSISTGSSTTIAAGSVISQTPAAGATATNGTAVSLVVSSGAPMVNVPTVVGSTQALATAAITGAGLTPGVITSANSATVPTNSVISQSPVGGTSVAPASSVDLVISLGPVLVAVPNVAGLTQALATSNITGVGLAVGAITTANSATIASGSVISQNPLGGASAPVGSAVTLVVSSGPTLITVPNVVGSTQAVATSTLTGAGLLTPTVTFASSSTVSAGNVIGQTPAAGASVVNGSATTLVVSLGAPPVVGPTVVRNSQGTALLRSPAITTVANSLLVAFVAADANPAGPNTTVTGVTNTGTPLTWTRATGTTAASQLGMAEIWWAYSTSAQSLINVSATLSSAKASSMTVTAFTGADPSLIGEGTAVVSAASGAPTASLTTTRGNSLVFGVGVDFSNGRTMVAGAGQTRLNQFVPTVNDTYWVQRVAAPVVTAGSTATISDTYAGAMTDMWNLALIEIRRP